MHYEDLTQEQIDKLAKLDTPEALLAFAKEEGYELSDEELEQVSGGGWKDKIADIVDKKLKCPRCSSYRVIRVPQPGVTGVIHHACEDCGHRWISAAGLSA